MNQKKPLQKIKSSVFSRGLSFAKLSLNAGTQLAGYGLNSLLKDEEGKAENWKSFLKGQAQTLSSELGQLKGSVMKAGQMLSMYGEHFLPPEANQFLKSLQSDSPPVAWKQMQEILQTRLTPEQLAELEIETESVGSASLGQVHRARVKKTDELLAIKIQYPGVENAIASDLKAIRSLLSMVKLLPKGPSTDHIFREVEEMLKQELNYTLEAQETKAYEARLHGDHRYVVPRVHPEFSGNQVLATSFEKGLSPDDPLVKSLSQERRNKLGLAFLDLYFKEIFSWGIVQTDPHLGNYRVRLNSQGDDQLVLLDFGAVRAYPADFLKSYKKMIRASLENNRTELRKATEELNFIKSDDTDERKQLFEDFCLASVEPFLDPKDPRRHPKFMNDEGFYDWKSSDLPQRLFKKGFELAQSFAWRTPPREILFLDRKTGGVFIFLTVLEAKIKGRDLLQAHLNQLSL